MNDYKFYIVFPNGDRQKLDIIELSSSMSYELDDYAVASRMDFYDENEAINYAKELANKNSITYVGKHSTSSYLD